MTAAKAADRKADKAEKVQATKPAERDDTNPRDVVPPDPEVCPRCGLRRPPHGHD